MLKKSPIQLVPFRHRREESEPLHAMAEKTKLDLSR